MSLGLEWFIPGNCRRTPCSSQLQPTLDLSTDPGFRLAQYKAGSMRKLNCFSHPPKVQDYGAFVRITAQVAILAELRSGPGAGHNAITMR